MTCKRDSTDHGHQIQNPHLICEVTKGEVWDACLGFYEAVTLPGNSLILSDTSEISLFTINSMKPKHSMALNNV